MDNNIEKKESNKTIILLLTIIIIILSALVILFATDTIVLNDKRVDNDTQVNDTTTDEGNNNTEVVEELSLEGTYKDESETADYVHSATIVITNQTSNSIDFDLSAYHGRDRDHINIGQLKRTAIKIDNGVYEFRETVEDKENVITIKFTVSESSKYLNITESYPDNVNPYAGHNVRFTGKYIQTS